MNSIFCGIPLSEKAKADLRSARQTQLREVLLKLLGASHTGGGLDLSDYGTRKLLQVPLLHLRRLLQGRHLSCLPSAMQWKRLSKTVELAGLHGCLDQTTNTKTTPIMQERGQAVQQPSHISSTHKRPKIGKDIEWTGDMDKSLVALRKQGSDWLDIALTLPRSASFMKHRYNQLQKDPDAPVPTGSCKKTSNVEVGYASLARRALERLPGRAGSTADVCEEILRMNLPEVEHFDRSIDQAPSHARREKWMTRVAWALHALPEFRKIGKKGRQFVWAL